MLTHIKLPLPTLLLVLFLAPFIDALPWQNSYVLAKLMMNQNFMQTNHYKNAHRAPESAKPIEDALKVEETEETKNEEQKDLKFDGEIEKVLNSKDPMPDISIDIKEVEAAQAFAPTKDRKLIISATAKEFFEDQMKYIKNHKKYDITKADDKQKDILAVPIKKTPFQEEFDYNINAGGKTKLKKEEKDLTNSNEDDVFTSDEDTSEPEGHADRGIGLSDIDSLVYGHVPEVNASSKEEENSDGGDDVVDEAEEGENDYENVEQDYDQENDEVPDEKDTIEAVEDQEAVETRNVGDQAESREYNLNINMTLDDSYFADDSKSKEMAVEEPVKTHRSDSKSSIDYEIPYALMAPVSRSYGWGPYYPWMTMQDILMRVEDAVVQLAHKEAEEVFKDQVHVNDEVVEMDGKKFLLKTITTKTDPKGRQRPYVALASVTPIIDSKEKHKRPKSSSVPSEEDKPKQKTKEKPKPDAGQESDSD